MICFNIAESDSALIINLQEIPSQWNVLNQSPVMQSAKIQNMETNKQIGQGAAETTNYKRPQKQFNQLHWAALAWNAVSGP